MSSDELQQKLMSLKAQREKTSQPIDPRAQLEYKKYLTLYNRIFPNLERPGFDYADVADAAGLKERRLREALVSRLALDDMVQLVGHHPGACYVCGSRIRGFCIEEPFCMNCLTAVDTAISSLYPPEASTKPAGTKPEAKDAPGINILDDLLACGAPLMAITGNPLYTRPDVLNVLYKPDDEPDEMDEIAALLQLDKRSAKELPPNADLRRFGFERTNHSRD